MQNTNVTARKREAFLERAGKAAFGETFLQARANPDASIVTPEDTGVYGLIIVHSPLLSQGQRSTFQDEHGLLIKENYSRTAKNDADGGVEIKTEILLEFTQEALSEAERL